jgi:DNA polymerase
MLVGEQPGDKEDIAGKPFVGPAGRLLDQALHDAGIVREETFVTNAVKHFKHEMRGKCRLHRRPDNYEIERCKIWLDFERSLVKPSTIVALGVTAARSLTGRTLTIGKVRGRPIDMADGTRLIVTVHPSALLRIEGDDERQAAYQSFVADLKAAARCVPAKRCASGRARSARRLRRTRRRPRHAGLRQRRTDLLHAVDEIDGRGWRQHQAAGGIAAAGDRRIWLDLVEPCNAEFDAQRLTVEDQTGHRIGEGFRNFGTIKVSDRWTLPLCTCCGRAWRGRACRRAQIALFKCHRLLPRRFVRNGA